MDMHSLYFVGYALIATIAGIVLVKAQYSRKKREGTPVNFKIIKVVFGFALFMWTGAAFAAVYYTSSTTATAIAGAFTGIVLTVFFGWQINGVIRKIQTDEKALEDLATHDALTGMWNRRVFHQTLKKEILIAEELGHPLSLLMLDIDNLSDINAEHGYEPGDYVLRKLAKIIGQAVRPTDTICRYRSKEIAIIFPKMRTQIAEKFARSFQAEIASHDFDIRDDQTVRVTITAGIVGYSDKTPTEPAFVDAGEEALFKAMEIGHNTLHVD
ncbi:MAG: GGDEF domain-containing protein [Candidatus Lindowbacteria bacterium]|nr:GGDEF domain-containing protein [Candidatus Lindowbacteria bacterium]